MTVARVFVTLKPGVLDPAGKAVEQGLHALGFDEVDGVRLGKYLEISFPDAVVDPQTIRDRVETMCRKLLANTVVESYRVEL